MAGFSPLAPAPPSPMSTASHDERARQGADADVSLPTSEETPTAGDGGKHPKATKTFIFEVSAGRPKGVGDATTGRSLRVDPPAPVVDDVVKLVEPDARGSDARTPRVVARTADHDHDD